MSSRVTLVIPTTEGPVRVRAFRAAPGIVVHRAASAGGRPSRDLWGLTQEEARLSFNVYTHSFRDAVLDARRLDGIAAHLGHSLLELESVTRAPQWLCFARRELSQGQEWQWYSRDSEGVP